MRPAILADRLYNKDLFDLTMLSFATVVVTDSVHGLVDPPFTGLELDLFFHDGQQLRHSVVISKPVVVFEFGLKRRERLFAHSLRFFRRFICLVISFAFAFLFVVKSITPSLTPAKRIFGIFGRVSLPPISSQADDTRDRR